MEENYNQSFSSTNQSGFITMKNWVGRAIVLSLVVSVMGLAFMLGYNWPMPATSTISTAVTK